MSNNIDNIVNRKSSIIPKYKKIDMYISVEAHTLQQQQAQPHP